MCHSVVERWVWISYVEAERVPQSSPGKAYCIDYVSVTECRDGIVPLEVLVDEYLILLRVTRM